MIFSGLLPEFLLFWKGRYNLEALSFSTVRIKPSIWMAPIQKNYIGIMFDLTTQH